MVNCVVVGCSNRTRNKPSETNYKSVGFYAIPKVRLGECQQTAAITAKRRAAWLQRIRRADLSANATHYRVCGEHFVTGRPTYFMDELNPDWAPSLKLGYKSSVADKPAAVDSHNAHKCLSKFQEMILFFIRLRMNVPLQDLAYRFGVLQSTVSRIVEKWLDVGYTRLSDCIKWPEREHLKKTMPMTFRKEFGSRVAVILDCFEIFIERPSSLVARVLTWSTYKHHNTVKYLIGIAHQGVITFISKGWGGRASDKLITESCGVLDNLLPGDSVLADRGFRIPDAVGVHCARLEIPAFTRGRAQLPPAVVESTRKLANVRIHVERVIGLVRNKYTTLKSTIPGD
ncbi:conserved hypothetical protein [Ixodes scapularis]|uniref:THAP-type domain-containing protein n=1 Tax=Ixodes scapularis TaxID=6945 RepID=B7PGF4_IXOSC|nr:conserved hypothetical protein [Ixodes scapularis]|eukprot:XP_002434276.1 conserved hypothetical protein [Ixodes scapularis]